MPPIVKLWRKVLQNHPIKANLNLKSKGCPKNKSISRKRKKNRKKKKKRKRKRKRKRKKKNTILNLQEDMHTNTKNLALSLI